MKTNSKRKIMNARDLNITFYIVLISINSFSQCKEWNWPPDKKAAEEKIALLQDAVNNKKYKQATKPLNWLLTNTPQLNSSIYIHGATIYDELASREKAKELIKKYTDSLMLIYDLRITQCGQKDYVLNRKAISAFKFYVNTPEANRVLPLMDSVFALAATEISDAVLLPYMQTIVLVQSKFKTLTEDQILTRYEKIMKVVDFKINQNKNNSKLQNKLRTTKKDIETWLFKVVKPDCDFVRSNLAPKFRQNPTDTVLAKRIFSFMLQGKCTEDPLWLETGELIFTHDKDYGLGKNLGLRYLALENNEKAEMYLDQSLAIAPTAADSAELYYYKGSLEAKKKNKGKARQFYLMSSNEVSRRKEAFERIGDLYYGSFDDCARKVNQADDRAVYLAAYEYYRKAGNEKKKAMAKQSFPSREEIFLVNYKVGDKIKVDCWINEEVTILTRD